ncbi:FtsB family cell division protein [Sabulicella glaciei]|uniref:Septum formation initiator family protein n=1 Tax=Sabulicella glaciei TaxID=2984948 RepID=A0ABT3NTD6_9PROT|nr:septum formation initiator family protein [Roseococcus sp. MDT2-1-1]MCW8085413.1 septum formation initiator family protein [Roseococcus sp. MDT2-1-1]
MQRVKRALGRAVRLLAAPVVLSAMTAFFLWHASHGERGLIAREARVIEIAEARIHLTRATEEREAAERRVNALRGEMIDQDQLEERARALLNLTQRDEIVIPYLPGQRVF